MILTYKLRGGPGGEVWIILEMVGIRCRVLGGRGGGRKWLINMQTFLHSSESLHTHKHTQINGSTATQTERPVKEQLSHPVDNRSQSLQHRLLAPVEQEEPLSLRSHHLYV